MSSTAAIWQPRTRVPLPFSPDSIAVGVAAVAGLLWFTATTPEGMHWFVIPVTVSAVLIGDDALRWARGKEGAFDPAGVIGLLGIYLYFIAPLLHVRWNHWMRYVQAPPDWRDWLGAMAILNCVGLACYRIARAWVARKPAQFRTARVIDTRRFWIVLPLALLIAATVQYWVYARFGGLLGYVLAFQTHTGSFRGLGIVFLISESFPILAFLGFAVLAMKHPRLSSWWALILVLIAFFALKIVFGGLRGSRSNTVWGLFWALGIIHLWIRPLPRRAILAGLPLFAAFMFSYGLYKVAGLQGLAALLDPPRAIELSNSSGRTLRSTLLGDLGRSDVQAYTLYRVQNTPAEDLGWGRTYIGGLAILIPRQLYPARPATKEKEATNILYGHGAFDAGHVTTRVYGLAGEALLNVGLIGVPIVFALWGLLVGLLRRAYYGLPRFDARVLMLPFWVNLLLIMLIGDSDNWVFFLFKEATVPLLILLFCSNSIRVRDPAQAGA